MQYKKSLVEFSIVTVIWVGIKYILLDIEFTTFITMLNPGDTGSSTTKFILIVSHLAFSVGNRYNFLRDKYWVSLIYKQKSYMLMY